MPMKKGDVIDKIKEQGIKAAINMAVHYANVTCPLVVYQPKMKESIKKLRKF